MMFIGVQQRKYYRIFISGVNERVRHVLERSNVDRMIGPENICADIHQALERASRIL